jgi:hypothetical protein
MLPSVFSPRFFSVGSPERWAWGRGLERHDLKLSGREPFTPFRSESNLCKNDYGEECAASLKTEHRSAI